ncbi:ras-like GTP-binding protein RhoL [Arctopsyche grandis]|uniref:ras-like GTP-binding protein RhoL n=1 Tax=Arctopsyche grandis TaxID=121162 RepID=UPI00406D86C6
MASGKIRPIKITIVGDGAVGKTCMLVTYTTRQFPNEYIPTVFDNFVDHLTVDGQSYNMTLWDTAGQEGFERLRVLSYPNTDCFILCYSVYSRTSYENISLKWFPELKHYSPRTPIILVATKKDLRILNTKDNIITTDEGKKLGKEIDAAAFIECSALTQEGLHEAFEEAVRAVLSVKSERSQLCTLL